MPLPVPVQRQREVVSLSPSGHTVVLGTAGSGKTTMAILRARFLSDPELPEAGRTLLLTFNKALVSYIRSIASEELANVSVENFHKFARGYLSSEGLLGFGQVIDRSRKDQALASAIAEVRARYKENSFFDRSLTYFSAEIAWLAQHGVVSAEDYKASERIGRSAARMETRFREAMWEIREAYLKERSKRGYRYDWDDLATAARVSFETDTSNRRYRHIVIDEGQDFSPEMLRCLASAVPADGSLTFFGDVAQQIYGHRMSWRSAGLRPPKVWEFSENYRNTAEIARLGLAIAAQPFYAGLPDMVQPKAPVAAGPKPTKVHFNTEGDQLAFVADQASRAALTQSVAVLARTNRQVRQLRTILQATFAAQSSFQTLGILTEPARMRSCSQDGWSSS